MYSVLYRKPVVTLLSLSFFICFFCAFVCRFFPVSFFPNHIKFNGLRRDPPTWHLKNERIRKLLARGNSSGLLLIGLEIVNLGSNVTSILAAHISNLQGLPREGPWTGKRILIIPWMQLLGPSRSFLFHSVCLQSATLSRSGNLRGPNESPQGNS